MASKKSKPAEAEKRKPTTIQARDSVMDACRVAASIQRMRLPEWIESVMVKAALSVDDLPADFRKSLMETGIKP